MNNKAKALSAALQRIERCESMVVTVKMHGFTTEPPDGLRRELDAESSASEASAMRSSLFRGVAVCVSCC